MLRAVARMISGKIDDAAALQQQIAALKTEASEEIDRLKSARAAAASFEEAEATDRAIARQVWICEHAAAEIPELELRLAAARAADQAAALAKHKAIPIGLYPRLKAAVLAAVRAQEEVMAAREAACKACGEAAVFRNLPNWGYADMLRAELYEVWRQENDRVFSDLQRQLKPAAIPAPVRAALPAPATKPAVAAKEPTSRPKRVVRHDPFPADSQNRLVIFIRPGCELPSGELAAIGDQVALPEPLARALVQSGAADYVPAAAS